MALDPRDVARLREEFEVERQMEERRAKNERYGAPAIFGPVCLDCDTPVERLPNGMWRHISEDKGCRRAVVAVSEVTR